MRKKKNLLYIFADQWRYHAIGHVGEDTVLTPNMDRFAKESVSCENAISTYPLCSPHRAALLTGKYPLSCGLWTNCKKGLAVSPSLATQEITLGDVLKKEGYDTAYIGKWHLDSSDMNYYDRPESGSVHWDAYTPPGPRRHGFDFWHSYGAMDKHLAPHYWEDTPEKIEVGKWSPLHEREVLLDYLDNKRDKEKPFCAVLSWNPPHPPYDEVPQGLKAMYEGPLKFRDNVPQSMRDDPAFVEHFKEYFGAISGLDAQFGLIMDYLKENNLLDDTLVVLSADHGDCMGSHGLYGKNVWYEEAIRIPLYIRDSSKEAKSLPCLIESCDQMPTLLDLLGVGIPSTVEGQSFKPLMDGKSETREKDGNTENKQGQQDTPTEKEYAFLCMLPGMPELIEPYKKLGLDSMCFGWRGLRTKDFTYVIDNGTEPGVEQVRYLYDNKGDPFQLNPEVLKKDSPECRKLDPILKGFCLGQKDFFLF
ncbi:MAG: sulfatase [Spirochaetia bacterium]|nr:sulfatase [Spirochaetia bacterium]